MSGRQEVPSPRPHRPVAACILFLGLLAATACAQFDPGDTRGLGPQDRDFDQVHLELELSLDLDKGEVAGTATHTLRSLVDALALVRFHAVGITVESVKIGDSELTHTTYADGTLLAIELPRPLRLAEQTTFTISYRAQPKRGLYFFKPSDDHPSIPYQVWSQGEGTDNRHWIPCYDLPDDRLTTSLSVLVPEQFTTLSNGRFLGAEEVEGQPQQRHRWVQEREHVTYLITLIVGEFADVAAQGGGVELHYLVPQGWAEHAGKIFGRTPRMIEFLSELTGVDYPYPRYTQATVWDFMYGGMENTGATTLNMRALYKEGVVPDYSADGLIAHELVHQWYGDLITCRTFNDIWLNEGFATYFTDLWFEVAEGRDAFVARRLQSSRKYMSRIDLEKTAAKPRAASPTECGDMAGNPYVKGSSALHMLRSLLGEQTWTAAVRAYTSKLADRSVTSEEMREIFESVSGRDLGWFWDQWVYGSGFPSLVVRHRFDKDSGMLLVTVDQAQPVSDSMPLFRLPVEVVWYDAGGKATARSFEVWRARHEWRIPCAEAPAFVRVDPDRTIVARVDESASLEEWRAQLAGDPSVVGRMLAAEALVGFGEAAVASLVECAHGDARFEVRKAACEALAQIEHVQATSALQTVASTREQDSRVRRAAIAGLASRPADQVAQTLAMLVADMNERDYVVAEAAAALGQCRAPGAFDALVEALARDSHRDIIRQRAIEGLKSLGDARAVEHVLPRTGYRHGRGLQHRSRHAALDAVVALAPADEEVRALVARLCDDPYFRMRSWAIGHAGELGLDRVTPVLSRLAAEDPSPQVRGAAKQAIEKLQARERHPAGEEAAATGEPTDPVAEALEAEMDRLELELETVRLRAALHDIERQGADR